MSGRRRASAILALLITGAGVLVTLAFFFLHGSVQSRSGRVEVEGLGGPVRIIFDRWAIPVISARDEADALRAQGFVHASERLWQLELFHRIARGRLAEVFGEEALDTDRLIRTLDLWSAAARELESMQPRDRRLLEAYAQGVNARIATWRGPWPPEFLLLGIEPQTWTAQASVAIGRIMSLDLSGWRDELDRTTVFSRVSPNRRAELAPGYPAWGPTIVQDDPPSDVARRGETGPGPAVADARGAPVAAGSAPPPAGARGPASSATHPGWDPLRTLASFGLHGSNSWALGGSRTADGHPLLANDMHLTLRAPATWYVNVLRAEGTDRAVAGLSIPGAPGVIVGFNRHLGWGFTNAMLDDADFVVESLDLDGGRYRDVDGWRPFEAREEVIEVRGRDDPVRHTVRSTRRGPIVTDVVPAGGLTLSLLWTGLESGGAASAILAMNRARDEDDLLRAIARFRSPHQNIIYATTSGSLGYRMSGSVPSRAEGMRALPVSFERLADGWPAFWPADSMPALSAPASDYLVSANNLQSWSAFGPVGFDYPVPFRARRITDRVSSAEGWTVDDMRDLQLDTYSLWAERLRPRAVAAARRTGADELAAELAAWNLRAEVGARGAAAFYVWLYRLRAAIASDEMGDGPDWFPDIAFQRILEDETSAWIDDARTPEPERLEALEEEAARVAALVVGRTWGEVHFERSSHPLGSVGWLDRLFRFHVGPVPARGARHTVRPDDPHRWSAVDSTSWTTPMLSEYGPSERFVAHLVPGRPTGHFLLPTGQSGNPLDPHYRDMARAWSAGALIEVGLDPETPAISSLELVPPDGP